MGEAFVLQWNEVGFGVVIIVVDDGGDDDDGLARGNRIRIQRYANIITLKQKQCGTASPFSRLKIHRILGK